jgi:hypothetical protein
VYLLEASLVGLSVLRAEQDSGRERKRRVTAWFVRLRLAYTSTALSFILPPASSSQAEMLAYWHQSWGTLYGCSQAQCRAYFPSLSERDRCSGCVTQGQSLARWDTLG